MKNSPEYCWNAIKAITFFVVMFAMPYDDTIFASSNVPATSMKGSHASPKSTENIPILSEKSSPADVVLRYLEMDSKGYELTDEGREAIAWLTIGPPESAQVVITTHVILGYKILGSRIHGDTATVDVGYDYVGVLTEDFYEFEPRGKNFNFEFKLNKVGNTGWKIAIGPAPMMSVEAVISHLKELEKTYPSEVKYKMAIKIIGETAKQHR